MSLVSKSLEGPITSHYLFMSLLNVFVSLCKDRERKVKQERRDKIKANPLKIVPSAFVDFGRNNIAG